MTESVSPQRSPGRAIVDAWCAFWFTPAPAYTLGLVRIGFGIVAVVWTLTLLPDLSRVFGAQGARPISLRATSSGASSKSGPATRAC